MRLHQCDRGTKGPIAREDVAGTLPKAMGENFVDIAVEIRYVG
jgi:hypothetical protein